ncbi:hypothetical protein D3C85_1668220 [compost metagenome]
MDHIVDAIQGAIQTLLVAHVTDEEAHALVALELLGHIPLLHLVTGEDDDFLGVVLGQGHRHESVAEGAGAAGDEDGFVAEHSVGSLVETWGVQEWVDR